MTWKYWRAWPFHAEVLLDEGGAVEIDGFGQLNGLRFALSGLLQAAHFFFKRRVDEDVEGIGRDRADSRRSRGPR